MSYAVNPYNFRASAYVKSNHQFVTALGTLIPLVTARVSTEEATDTLPALPTTPFPLITPQELVTFSFPVQQVDKLLQQAKSYKNDKGFAEKLLTEKQLAETLLRQQALQETKQAGAENELTLLQALGYYFNDIADAEIQTGVGTLRAISAKQLKKLATQEGDPERLTYKDIVNYLGNTPPVPTYAEIARRLERSELIIQLLPASVSPILKPEVETETEESLAAVTNTGTFTQTKDATSKHPNQNRDAMGFLGEFNYDVKEVMAAINQKGYSVDRESLTMLLKHCFEGLHQLESQLQAPNQSEQEQERLKLQLAGTRRLYNLATLLKDHCDE